MMALRPLPAISYRPPRHPPHPPSPARALSANRAPFPAPHPSLFRFFPAAVLKRRKRANASDRNGVSAAHRRTHLSPFRPKFWRAFAREGPSFFSQFTLPTRSVFSTLTLGALRRFFSSAIFFVDPPLWGVAREFLRRDFFFNFRLGSLFKREEIEGLLPF